MRVALVHDYLIQFGGGERVLQNFCELFPYAPIFTMAYDETATGGIFKDRNLYTSFLQKIPFIGSHHRAFPLLMPLAIEQFDFRDFDLVLSSSNSYAKGVLTGPDTLHLCYCHTPMRYAWDDCHRHMREFSYAKPVKKLIPFGINYLRMWDRLSADRPNRYIANSHFVAGRIKKYYKQNSTVIYPPVGADKFKLAEKTSNYFLLVGRALPYKRFDIVIEAFNHLGWPLKIIASGPEIPRLQAHAKSNVEFLGYVSDERLTEYYTRALAFIVPAEEDFGITPLEAMAAGRPVIAYRGGGVTESVLEGETGIFFDRQTPESLIKTLRDFHVNRFDSITIQNRARLFHEDNFKQQIEQFMAKAYRDFKK